MEDIMPITKTIRESFERSFGLYRAFVDTVDESAVESKLPQVPSNTIGNQMWCVVGARESYCNAIQAGEWRGFSCSLKDVANKEKVAEALDRSAHDVLEALENIETYSDAQNRLIVDLLEHEIAHQGQLIRYLYGLGLSIPESWKVRYALE